MYTGIANHVVGNSVTVCLSSLGDELALSLIYATPLFSASTAQRILDGTLAVLARASASPADARPTGERCRTPGAIHESLDARPGTV